MANLKQFNFFFLWETEKNFEMYFDHRTKSSLSATSNSFHSLQKFVTWSKFRASEDYPWDDMAMGVNNKPYPLSLIRQGAKNNNIRPENLLKTSVNFPGVS